MSATSRDAIWCHIKEALAMLKSWTVSASTPVEGRLTSANSLRDCLDAIFHCVQDSLAFFGPMSSSALEAVPVIYQRHFSDASEAETDDIIGRF